MSEPTIICKVCGQQVDANAPNCPVCGAVNEHAVAAVKPQVNKNLVACKACGQEIAKSVKTCPQCGAKNKKPIYKRWWLWLIVAVALITLISAIGDDSYVPNEFQYENYKKVETIFKDAGFTNIELVEAGKTTAESGDGKVDEVTVDGKTVKNLAEAEALGKDAKVSIFYETFDAAAAAANVTEAEETEENTTEKDSTTQAPKDNAEYADSKNKIVKLFIPDGARDVEISSLGIDYVSPLGYDETIEFVKAALEELGASALGSFGSGLAGEWIYVGMYGSFDDIEVSVSSDDVFSSGEVSVDITCDIDGY